MPTFAPLSTEESLFCSVITVEGAPVLLDCGLSEDPEYLGRVEAVLPTVQFVLLSGPSLRQLGLLPSLVAKGLSCPIYASLPTKEMGRHTLNEYLKALEEENQRADFTFEDVKTAMGNVISVKFNQPISLGAPLKGYVLTAHRAGHTLGSSFFTLKPSLSFSNASTMLYCPVFNHMKEHHVDSAGFFTGGRLNSAFRGVGLVILGAANALKTNTKRVDREKLLVDTLSAALNGKGSVFLPTDTAGRIFELLVFLESHWRFKNLKVPICVLAYTARESVEYVRSLTEWMNATVSPEVLRFAHVKVYTSVEALVAAHPDTQSKVVLSTPSSLSHSLSRAYFADHFAKSPKNALIFTEEPARGTLAAELFDAWNAKQKPAARWGRGVVGRPVALNTLRTVELERRVFLEGDELAAFEAAERAQADKAAKQQALLERSRQRQKADEAESDSDEESVREEEFKEDTVKSFDIFVYKDFASRPMPEGPPRFRLFPANERKRRVDAYGEAIDVQGWLERGVTEEFQQLAAALVPKKPRPAPAPKVRPHKFISESKRVSVACGILAIDYGGTADGRALKTIIPQIAPKRVILVNASLDALNELSNSVRASDAARDVVTPFVGETVAAGDEAKTHPLRLGDAMLASLRLTRVGQYDVAQVTGTVSFDPEANVQVFEREESERDERLSILPGLGQADPVAQGAEKSPAVSPHASAPGSPRASSLSPPLASLAARFARRSRGVGAALPPLPLPTFIGDVKLSTLKETLASLGVAAEFVGEGVLVCGPAASKVYAPYARRIVLQTQGQDFDSTLKQLSGNKVYVKKQSRGRLVIQGSPGETYHIVRSVVYSFYGQ